MHRQCLRIYGKFKVLKKLAQNYTQYLNYKILLMIFSAENRFLNRFHLFNYVRENINFYRHPQSSNNNYILRGVTQFLIRFNVPMENSRIENLKLRQRGIRRVCFQIRIILSQEIFFSLQTHNVILITDLSCHILTTKILRQWLLICKYYSSSGNFVFHMTLIVPTRNRELYLHSSFLSNLESLYFL